MSSAPAAMFSSMFLRAMEAAPSRFCRLSDSMMSSWPTDSTFSVLASLMSWRFKPIIMPITLSVIEPGCFSLATISPALRLTKLSVTIVWINDFSG